MAVVVSVIAVTALAGLVSRSRSGAGSCRSGPAGCGSIDSCAARSASACCARRCARRAAACWYCSRSWRARSVAVVDQLGDGGLEFGPVVRGDLAAVRPHRRRACRGGRPASRRGSRRRFQYRSALPITGGRPRRITTTRNWGSCASWAGLKIGTRWVVSEITLPW